MNVQRTMDFILRQQAKAESRQDKFKEEFRKSKQDFDRRFRVVWKMFLEGAARMDRTEQMIRDLAESQKRADGRAEARFQQADARLTRCETMLERLIAAWERRSPNGRR
jgi:hypothetical protein